MCNNKKLSDPYIPVYHQGLTFYFVNRFLMNNNEIVLFCSIKFTPIITISYIQASSNYPFYFGN